MDFGEGCNDVVRGERVGKDTITSPRNANPSPKPVTEAHKQSKVTATRKTAEPKKLEPKSKADNKTAAGKSKSHHVDLALYADDTAIIATSHKPKLLVSYLESYLNDLQRWLSEWRIVVNVSKNTAIIFARAGRRFIQPQPVTLFGETIEWVETTRYLG
jgi:hypothetical protein